MLQCGTVALLHLNSARSILLVVIHNGKVVIQKLLDAVSDDIETEDL